VKEAQALRAVYTARAARAERSLPALTTGLETACTAAERQLLEQIAQESGGRLLRRASLPLGCMRWYI
jgi:hypothetical protein